MFIIGISWLLVACDWNVPHSNEGLVQVDSMVVEDTMAAKIDTTVLEIDNTRNTDTAILPPFSTN